MVRSTTHGRGHAVGRREVARRSLKHDERGRGPAAAGRPRASRARAGISVQRRAPRGTDHQLAPAAAAPPCRANAGRLSASRTRRRRAHHLVESRRCGLSITDSRSSNFGEVTTFPETRRRQQKPSEVGPVPRRELDLTRHIEDRIRHAIESACVRGGGSGQRRSSAASASASFRHDMALVTEDEEGDGVSAAELRAKAAGRRPKQATGRGRAPNSRLAREPQPPVVAALAQARHLRRAHLRPASMLVLPSGGSRGASITMATTPSRSSRSRTGSRAG